MMTTVRLLLVDDEPSVLRLMAGYLQRVGYQVDPCASGREARAAFDAAPDQYSAVIVDLSLPDLSGRDLLLHVRHLRPGIAAVVCSGSPGRADDHPGGPTRYLLKPFLPGMLADTVRDLLAPA